MRKTVLVVVLLLLGAAMAVAQSRKTLDIYVVDVEGGNAVLFVTPSGESMLVDSGNGGRAKTETHVPAHDADPFLLIALHAATFRSWRASSLPPPDGAARHE